MTHGPEPDFPASASLPIRRWRIGRAELDERNAQLSIDGQPVALDRSSYDLLLCLIENVGQTVSKEALMLAGWPGRVVSENSLTKAIGRLRAALADADGDCLRVVHGYGYRLTAPVELLAASAVLAPGPELPVPAPAPSPLSAALPEKPRGRRLLSGAIGLLALLTAAAVIWSRLDAPPPALAAASASALPSIAVLPFVDLSSEQDQLHFSDGLADQLLDDLSRLPQLRVVARTSSFAYRNQQTDIPSIGRALNASTVLEGSVRRSGDRLRVTVQLISAADGFHLWSQTYDRPITELFAMQDEMARAIIGALRVELLPEQLGNPAQRGTRNPDAYEQFLRARTLFKDDETGGRRALEAYQRALSLDPGFVDAWMELADLLGHNGFYADTAEEALAGKRRAMQALDTAIGLDPTRADAYLMRGDLRYAHWWDWVGAEKDIEQAAALGAKQDDPYLIRLSRLRAALGRLPESIELARRATQINPSSVGWRLMGYHLLALGDFAAARTALAQALSVQPLDEHAHYYLGLIELLEGDVAQALPHFNDSAHFLRLTGLAMAEHTLGDAAASERSLQVLISRYGHITPYQAADVYAWRGQPDQAFAWLERAYELHDASFMYLKFDPLLNSLRADPRFADLLKRVNLPP